MKAFRFRLEQALRWRATQVDIEKAKVAAASNVVQGIRSQIEIRRTALAGAVSGLAGGATGLAVQTGGAWISRCRREIVELEQRAVVAEREMAAAMQCLVQANRNMQLLEKLRQAELTRWQADSARELEAFASETFLRQVTIRKRTGA